MNRYLKIISLFLSLVLLSGTFCACGEAVTSALETTLGGTTQSTTPGSENNQPGTPDPSTGAKQYDIVVYGDTPAAIVAAVAASRQNALVALIAPNQHLGGMMTGGLFETDKGNSAVIGGMSKEFFERNAAKKGNASSSVDWYFEPHVAEEIFNDMINETKDTDYPVEVFLGERLSENAGVEMTGTTITTITCESGKKFTATNFIDASYEGDLMAQAKVTYTYGREGRDEYGESLAGVVSPNTQGANNHNFAVNVYAYDENGNLKYQEVSTEPLAPVGSGDKKIQAYNFRVCLTDDPNNMLPFPMPEGYEPARYALLADYLVAWMAAKGRAPKINEIFIPGHEVNGKRDFNNRGAFSTDYIGGNYNYPDATYAEREEIWNEHYKYVMGLFYFLCNDPSVPGAVRNTVSAWGLPKDEYQDSGNFTFQLYVREGRRMIGEYVMTQKDIQKGGGANLTKADSIGMGSYNSDSHHVQRYITADGYIRNEGNMEVKVDPYEIPYRMLLPKKEEATNLLVSCTFSASHVAYSTIRMEPQYMIIGEAAGTAAAISVHDKTGVHDIDVSKLQGILIHNGAVLTLTNQNLMNVEFDDSFENWRRNWSEAYGKDTSLAITQNESSITMQKGVSVSGYAYLTREGFVAPANDFEFGFKAKLNSYGKAEVAIRSGNYLIRVVLTNDGATGTVADSYLSPIKSAEIDTSVWHEYKVVVKKGANNQYTYDLYVDGTLAWENAFYTTGTGSEIFKVGLDAHTAIGGKTTLDLELDSLYLKLS